MRELSKRSWCPNCEIERTGDDLTRPCACMARTIKRERYGTILRVVEFGNGGNLFVMNNEAFRKLFLS